MGKINNGNTVFEDSCVNMLICKFSHRTIYKLCHENVSILHIWIENGSVFPRAVFVPLSIDFSFAVFKLMITFIRTHIVYRKTKTHTPVLVTSSSPTSEKLSPLASEYCTCHFDDDTAIFTASFNFRLALNFLSSSIVSPKCKRAEPLSRSYKNKQTHIEH